MSLATRIVTLMSSLTSFQVRGMPPFERLRLANECRRLLRAADPPVMPPRAPSASKPPWTCGVLAELREGARSL